jgi:hypothetical protein
MRILSIAVIILLLPSSASAQAPATALLGSWQGCFRMDSVRSAPGTEQQECGQVTFTSDTVCGELKATVEVAIDSLRWWIPAENRYRALPYNQGIVTYRIGHEDIMLVGHPDWSPTPSGGIRCVISGDDGSLYARFKYAPGTVAGDWGILWFGDSGPLGTFTIRRVQ